MSTGYYSREALRARLGDEAFEAADREAANAPEPTPEIVEIVRRVFAPTLKRLRAEATAPR